MWNVLNKTRTGIAVIAMAGVLTLTSAQAQSQPPAGEPQPTPVPEVPLVGRDGTPVPGAAAFPLTGRWLLVVVRPNCAPCEALLTRIQGDAWTAVIPRLVIVTSGAPAAEATRLATLNPSLEAAVWYADEPAGLATALHLQESPVVLAVNDRGIQWTLAGVLSGSKRMQDVLTAWVKNPVTPRTPTPIPPGAER